MDLSTAVTVQRPGAAPLDINSIRDTSLVGSAPLSGYSIEAVDFSTIGINAYMEDVPQLDGSDSYEPYLGPRFINMTVAVYGATYSVFWDNITALISAFQPRPAAANVGTYPALDADGRRKLSFSQPKVGGSYSLYMMVRPTTMPQFMTDKSAFAGNPSLGYATLVSVSLIAEDPFKYFETTASFSRTGSGTISVVNSGTTSVWPTISWANGATSAVTSATLGADVVSHSTLSGTITDVFKTASSSSPLTLTGYSFFSIPPGTSTVTVSAAASATVTITIREALL